MNVAVLAIFSASRHNHKAKREPCHRRAMATHMVKVREDLLQKLIALSQETGKPMSDLIEEVLDWARQQSQLRRSRAS